MDVISSMVIQFPSLRWILYRKIQLEAFLGL